MNPTMSESILPETRVARSDAVVFTDLGDTVVMMDVDQGCYYELDAIGAAIWSLVESGPRVSEVCEALAARYDVAPDRCGSEVRAFLDELRHHDVIRMLPDTPGDGSPSVATPALPVSPRPAVALPRPAEGSGGDAWTTPTVAWTTPAVRVLETVRQVATGNSYQNTAAENQQYDPDS